MLKNDRCISCESIPHCSLCPKVGSSCLECEQGYTKGEDG